MLKDKVEEGVSNIVRINNRGDISSYNKSILVDIRSIFILNMAEVIDI